MLPRLATRYAAAIDIELAAILDRLAVDLTAEFHLSPAGTGLFAQLRDYALRPGKRLRGCLAAAAYDSAAGTADGRAGIALGAVLELLQSYLLIIDDVMDRTAVRRGGPALQQYYADELADGVPAHAADMLAICAGLILQHAANLALLELPVPAAYQAAALAVIHRNLLATGLGQCDDLAQRTSAASDEQDVLRTLRLKTSYYTIVNPIQAGFALAGVTDAAALSAAKRFGEAAGIVFQLQDDFLDVFGTAADLGRPPGSDLREGARTLLLHAALERATAAQRAALEKIVGNRHADEADIRAARDIIAATGAASTLQRTVRHYAALARQELADARFGDDDFRAVLGGILDSIVRR